MIKANKELAGEIAKALAPYIKETKRDWIKATCEEVVPDVLEKTFIKFGIDTTDPIEMQKDFSHLRASRKTKAEIHKKIYTEAARVLFIGFLSFAAASWAYAKGKF